MTKRERSRAPFPRNPDSSGGINVNPVEVPVPSRNGGSSSFSKQEEAAIGAAKLRYQRDLQREENRQNFTLALLFVGSIVCIVVASFVYAGLANDKDLPGEVIKDVFVFLGGGGIGTLIGRRE
ncbi:hypothetical protein [cf. Phormidesmis sp. LEGE 11477]|uniref:hypothetical protein n=1 Tax=cf. Phormidesmis sp. LEGE 11477 TaxID=1828680 RepID=UPI0018803ED5|nr:hypothetical protein [cf. Phormidesmis sp. LEGE 11477]MBE9063478.1 hypothetical protein [cf. Phormidesmis sp. LEGE 11477]